MTSEEYAKYLANLLIIQYHDKPKAKATIELITKDLPIDILFAVEDGFDLGTAVGKQLDILGKYIGIDRFFINRDNEIQALTDDEYRQLLRFKVICNNTNMSHYQIDTAIFNFFGYAVHAESEGNMQMTYYIPSQVQNIIEAALQKDVMPRPMGVQIRFVIQQDHEFFAYCTYDNQYAYYRTGFRTYDDPDKVGECLTYDKIAEIIHA